MQQWKPRDEQSWSMTEKSIRDDPEIGAKFLVFLNFWLNTAEKIMEEGEPMESMAVYVASKQPANAVRKALEVAEQRLGFLDVWFLGQLLAVIGIYWQHGDEMIKGLSAIERKVAGEALAYKIHELQESADADDDDPGLAGAGMAVRAREADPGSAEGGPADVGPGV